MIPLNPPGPDGKRISIGYLDPDEVNLRHAVAEFTRLKSAREPLEGPRVAITEIIGRRPDLATRVCLPSEIHRRP